MQDVFIRLLRAYRRHGFLVRTGLNPFYFGDADAPFARLFTTADQPVGVGAGLAPQEIAFLQLLLATTTPSNVLIVGNAFGWSSVAVGMAAPGATVVAMEAGLEGDGTDAGTALTHAIAGEEQLNVRVVKALSPRDTPTVVATEFAGAPLDFVLIDGLHVNEQLLRDVEGILPYAAPHCIFFLHDVLSWHMLSAFEQAPFGEGRERCILTRCPSGPGLIYPSSLDPATREIVEAYCDATVDLPTLLADLGASSDRPGPRLERRLARGWKHRRVGMAETYAVEGQTALERQALQSVAEERPDDAVAQYQVGVHHADRGRWPEAERYLRQALALAPEWPQPVQQLGRVLRELDRLDEANVLLERAATMAPAWAAPVFELGLLAEKAGRLTEAYQLVSRASELEPGWTVPYEAAGRVAYQLGAEHADARRWPDAETYLREAVSRRPDWATPLQQLGRVLRERGEFAEARQCLERAIALEPAWAAPYFELGQVSLAIHAPDAAYRWFTQAADLAPEWTLALLECGRAAFAVGDDTRAMRVLRSVLDAGSITHGVPHLLALATERVSGHTAATPLFMLALAVAPGSPEVQFDAARMLAARGDEDLALAHFNLAGQLRPEWDAPWSEAFALACRLGRAADADRAANQLAELGVESVEGWLAVAHMDAAAGAGEAARQAALRVLGLRPEPVEPLKALGVRLMENGDTAAAERLFRDLVERFPDWAGVQFLRARALEALARVDEARLVYGRAAALRPSWAEPREALARLAASGAIRKAS
ncbi:MAG: tetratricopeptide repeat protein [Vicinamibacterales bacterium]